MMVGVKSVEVKWRCKAINEQQVAIVSTDVNQCVWVGI